MKRVKYLLLLLMVTFVMTGCVKYNTTMDIKKDKSMTFSIIMAVDKSMFGDDTEAVDEETRDELTKAGFKVSDYKDGNMVGFKIEKEVKNIDDISTKDDTNFDLVKVVGKDGKFENVFTVKKGFLKNTYKASFKFDSTESKLNDTVSYADTKNVIAIGEDDDDDEYGLSQYDNDELDDDFDLTTYGEDEDDDDDYTSSSDDDVDLSSLSSMGNMDLSFNVKLPYAAKSSNATTKSDGGKTLKWDLTQSTSSGKATNIEFEFELYNMKTIYLLIGGAVVVIAAIAFIVVKNKKGGNNTGVVETTQEPIAPTPTFDNVTPVEPQTTEPTLEPQTTEPTVEAPVESAPSDDTPVSLGDINNNN